MAYRFLQDYYIWYIVNGIPQGMNYCPTGLTFSPFLFCGELRLWKSVVYTLYDVHDGLKPSPV